MDEGKYSDSSSSSWSMLDSLILATQDGTNREDLNIIEETFESLPRSPPPFKDDRNGQLIYSRGDVIGMHYKILRTLGEGAFCRVVEVLDINNKSSPRRHYALKVVKNVEKYRQETAFELKVLRHLAEKDPLHKFPVTHLIQHFDYFGHVCLMFDLLGPSLFEFLKKNNYKPYPMDQIRYIAYQLLNAVDFLHRNQLTHTDLKPENILLVNGTYIEVPDEDTKSCSSNKRQKCVRVLKDASIKLCDFGLAVFDEEDHSSIVTTREYRAPEVIMDIGWYQPCDYWSIGCILFELYTGAQLFQTHKNREHLAMIERVIGKIPTWMGKKSHLKTEYFYNDGRLDLNRQSDMAIKVQEKCHPLSTYKYSNDDEDIELFDLIRRMLEIDTGLRIKFKEARVNVYFKRLCPLLRAKVDELDAIKAAL